MVACKVHMEREVTQFLNIVSEQLPLAPSAHENTGVISEIPPVRSCFNFFCKVPMEGPGGIFSGAETSLVGMLSKLLENEGVDGVVVLNSLASRRA